MEVGDEEPLLLWTLLTRRYGPRPYRPAAEDLAIHASVLRSVAPGLDPAPRRRNNGDTGDGTASIHSIGR